MLPNVLDREGSCGILKAMKRLRILPLLLLPFLSACTPYLSNVSTLQTGTASEILEQSSPALSAFESNVNVTLPVIASGSLLEIGKTSAPLTLLVFTNHSCSYCRDFWERDVPRLQTDFISSGTLRLEIAILPMKKYPESEREALSLFCAATQGKGSAMHGALFLLPRHSESAMLSAAKALGLDLSAFRTCLSSPAAASALHVQESLAKQLNVTLAPTLILQDEKKVGLQPYADLRGWIEDVLQKQK